MTPAFVARDHAFARPNDAQNVVRVVGRGSGPLDFFGLGAGGDASASSVVGDIVAAVEARAPGLVPIHRPFGEAPEIVSLRLPFVVRSAAGVRVTEPLALAAGAALARDPAVDSALPLLASD